jgi:hypothetical protein
VVVTTLQRAGKGHITVRIPAVGWGQEARAARV